MGCDEGSVLLLQVVDSIMELLDFGLVLVDDFLESLYFPFHLYESGLIIFAIELIMGFFL